MRAIAFAYADVPTAETALYRTCAEGVVANVRRVMPGVPVFHITDEHTRAIGGCNVLRIPHDDMLMPWRLAAHYCAHSVADEVLFTEPDVRFNENVMNVFDDPDFDIAISDRDGRVSYQGEEVTETAPYTQGSTFSRNPKFWKDATKFCRTLDRKKQLWFGDMLAIAHVIDGGAYRVRVMDARVYNHIPLSYGEKSDAKVVHYKGRRKEWLFPVATEAMEEAA